MKYQMEMLEWKTTTEINLKKKSLKKWLNSNIEVTEEMISELENETTEIIQYEHQRENSLKKQWTEPQVPVRL